MTSAQIRENVNRLAKKNLITEDQIPSRYAYGTRLPSSEMEARIIADVLDIPKDLLLRAYRKQQNKKNSVPSLPYNDIEILDFVSSYIKQNKQSKHNVDIWLFVSNNMHLLTYDQATLKLVEKQWGENLNGGINYHIICPIDIVLPEDIKRLSFPLRNISSQVEQDKNHGRIHFYPIKIWDNETICAYTEVGMQNNDVFINKVPKMRIPFELRRQFLCLWNNGSSVLLKTTPDVDERCRPLLCSGVVSLLQMQDSDDLGRALNVFFAMNYRLLSEMKSFIEKIYEYYE